MKNKKRDAKYWAELEQLRREAFPHLYKKNGQRKFKGDKS